MTFGASDGRKNGARGGVEPRTGGAVEPVQPIRRGPGRVGHLAHRYDIEGLVTIGSEIALQNSVVRDSAHGEAVRHRDHVGPVGHG